MKKIIGFTSIAVVVTAVAILLCVVISNGRQAFVAQELPEDAIKQAWPSYDRTLNIVPGLPVTFTIPEDAADSYMYEVSVSHCQFIEWYADITPDYGILNRGEDGEELGQSFTLSQTRTVYWETFEIDPETNKRIPLGFDVTEDVFVEVIIWEEGHIVGFAVLEIYSPDGSSMEFSIRMLDSAYYPMVDGEYQAVTEEYIAKQIAKAKR